MRLELRGVAKSYGGQRVLCGVDLSLDGVRSLVLVGPSGGGKSTLLRILGGLERPDAGELAVDGRMVGGGEGDLLSYRRTVGTVFQNSNLFPHLTALENIALPLREVHGASRREAAERARETLDRFQLLEHAGKRPAQLSGGQNQRVAIARAVSIRPSLLLFDEPTSALDPEMTAEVLELVGELQADGRDFVLATHEIAFARRVAEHAAYVADGTIVDHGPAAETLTSPRHPDIAKFLGKVLVD